jgi:hypothetical protein
MPSKNSWQQSRLKRTGDFLVFTTVPCTLTCNARIWRIIPEIRFKIVVEYSTVQYSRSIFSLIEQESGTTENRLLKVLESY